MKKSKSKSKKNVRSGFLVFMAAIVLGTMGIILYLIRGGAGGKSNVKCGGATSGSCDSGYDCMKDATTGKFKCVPPCTVDTCLDKCTIVRQYKKKPNFQTDLVVATWAAAGAPAGAPSSGCMVVTACNPTKQDCVKIAKKKCDNTPGCMSFGYIKNADDTASWCPYVEYQNQKGRTTPGHDFYYIDNVNDITCSCEDNYYSNSDDTKLCQNQKA